MKALLLTLLLLGTTFGAIIRSYIDEKGRQIDHHVGSYMVTDKTGTPYRVTYNVEMLGGDLVTSLDEVAGISKVQCDLNNIEMVVNFNSVPDAYNFYKSVQGNGFDKFLTSGKYTCGEVQTNSFMTFRRVVESEISGVTVLLRTAQGTYEETIKEGSVQLEPIDVPEEHSKTFCFGVNANTECTAAKNSIPLYQNKFLEISCSNCFVGTKATVFVDFRISWFKLRHIGAGFRDISVNGAFVLDLNAHASASASHDRTYRLVDQGLLVQFWIAFVPITIWYEIPVQIVATAMIDAQAHATAGVKASWRIGDAYVDWDESYGWRNGRPNPTFSWEPVLTGDASFKAEASLSIIPSVIVHVMRIIQTGVRLAPTVTLDVAGDTNTKQICADLSYKVSADLSASVTLNLPLIKVFEKTFGPKELFNTGVKPIGHWCIGTKDQPQLE